MKKALYIGLFCVGLFAKEVDLSAELSAWKSLSYRAATKDSNGTLSATLELNKASYVGLINTPKIQYVSRPTNEGGSVSYGGMFQVEIKQKGIYRVSLGNASWIELVKDGKLATSVAHQRGPQDSGIRKIVDYALEAGVYTLQLSASGDSATALLITKIK